MGYVESVNQFAAFELKSIWQLSLVSLFQDTSAETLFGYTIHLKMSPE
jgi:hypothetical protein